MKPVHLDSRAETDLFEITSCLVGFGAQSADQFVNDYWSVIEQLRRFPESGQASGDDPSKRIARRGVYRFVYELTNEDVLLLRILDGRTQPELP